MKILHSADWHLGHQLYGYDRTEEQLEPFKAPGSKLWTVKQIEENIVSGVFSKMFESEFPYFKSTVLLAENY